MTCLDIKCQKSYTFVNYFKHDQPLKLPVYAPQEHAVLLLFLIHGYALNIHARALTQVAFLLSETQLRSVTLVKTKSTFRLAEGQDKQTVCESATSSKIV